MLWMHENHRPDLNAICMFMDEWDIENILHETMPSCYAGYLVRCTLICSLILSNALARVSIGAEDPLGR